MDLLLSDAAVVLAATAIVLAVLAVHLLRQFALRYFGDARTAARVMEKGRTIPLGLIVSTPAGMEVDLAAELRSIGRSLYLLLLPTGEAALSWHRKHAGALASFVEATRAADVPLVVIDGGPEVVVPIDRERVVELRDWHDHLRYTLSTNGAPVLYFLAFGAEVELGVDLAPLGWIDDLRGRDATMRGLLPATAPARTGAPAPVGTHVHWHGMSSERADASADDALAAVTRFFQLRQAGDWAGAAGLFEPSGVLVIGPDEWVGPTSIAGLLERVASSGLEPRLVGAEAYGGRVYAHVAPQLRDVVPERGDGSHYVMRLDVGPSGIRRAEI